MFALAVFALHLESERREQEVQPCPTVPCADDMVVIIPVEINIKYEAVAGPNPDAVAARYSRERMCGASGLLQGILKAEVPPAFKC